MNRNRKDYKDLPNYRESDCGYGYIIGVTFTGDDLWYCEYKRIQMGTNNFVCDFCDKNPNKTKRR